MDIDISNRTNEEAKAAIKHPVNCINPPTQRTRLIPNLSIRDTVKKAAIKKICIKYNFCF